MKMVYARATSSTRCPSTGGSRKPREVDRVPGIERVAYLAQLLEAANPRSLPGPTKTGRLRSSISAPSGGMMRNSE